MAAVILARRWSLRDRLTGLDTSSAFTRSIDRQLAQGVGRTRFAVLVVHVDRFRKINESLGRDAGDRLLRLLADRLRDYPEPLARPCRLEGNKLALLVSAQDEGSARRRAALVRTMFEAPVVMDGLRVHAGCSIGVAIQGPHGATAGALLNNAEAAMYRAKCACDGVSVFIPVDAADAFEQLTAVDLLRQGLEEDHGFALVYQPQIDLQSGRMTGVEALVRWTHPSGRTWSPAAFLPLIEEAGLMKQLTAWVLRTAGVQAAQWWADGNPITVAVNVSPSAMDADLPPLLADCLQQNGLSSDAIKLEITEDLFVGDQTRVLQVLHAVRELGCAISVDDFGTGYSSFGYLRYLPVSELKIDQSFVRPMLQDPRARSLVESIVDMGHRLGLMVVAEGIEDARTLDQLRAMGADQAQGYHLGMPWSPAELEQRMGLLKTIRADIPPLQVAVTTWREPHPTPTRSPQQQAS